MRWARFCSADAHRTDQRGLLARADAHRTLASQRFHSDIGCASTTNARGARNAGEPPRQRCRVDAEPNARTRSNSRAERAERLCDLLAEADELRGKLLELMVADTQVYGQVSAAYGMPRAL